MEIRPVRPEDREAWLAMRAALWPEEDLADLREGIDALFDGSWDQTVLVYEDAGALIGMIELSERLYAEGCETSPVAFIEGWFVAEEKRGKGVGRSLVKAAEAWARAKGHSEIGSDTQLWNENSQKAHAALGFEEVERIVAFRKAL